jgi:hypothetical protein
MSRNAPELPTKVSRASMSKIASPAYDRPRKADDNSDGGDVCLDNDLGAEWTGNMDCDDGSKKNDDSDKRKDRS